MVGQLGNETNDDMDAYINLKEFRGGDVKRSVIKMRTDIKVHLLVLMSSGRKYRI